LRVATFIGIRFIAHCSSQPASAASLQLGSGNSLPVAFERTRGRSTSTLPP
jgi:hypothetical protein